MVFATCKLKELTSERKSLKPTADLCAEITTLRQKMKALQDVARRTVFSENLKGKLFNNIPDDKRKLEHYAVKNPAMNVDLNMRHYDATVTKMNAHTCGTGKFWQEDMQCTITD